jgi:hypothetical protein
LAVIMLRGRLKPETVFPPDVLTGQASAAAPTAALSRSVPLAGYISRRRFANGGLGAMTIEINTLYHVSVTVSALLGVLLLYSWWLTRQVQALAWWSVGFFLVAVGLGLLAARGGIHHIASIAIANAVVFLGAACFWTGARAFEGRRPYLAGLALGSLIWLVLCAIPAFYGSINARTLVASAILGVYALLAAYELWAGRAVPLLTRWPSIALLTFHGALFFVRDALVVMAPLEEGLPGATSVWFVLLHYEVILYEIALAFCFLAMAKERAGQKLVIA